MEKPSAAGADKGSLPMVVDRATFQAELDGLRAREIVSSTGVWSSKRCIW